MPDACCLLLIARSTDTATSGPFAPEEALHDTARCDFLDGLLGPAGVCRRIRAVGRHWSAIQLRAGRADAERAADSLRRRDTPYGGLETHSVRSRDGLSCVL